jgi:glyoxylase-like metal-dependent hydrolase (beta-lactamase superfamily II)
MAQLKWVPFVLASLLSVSTTAQASAQPAAPTRGITQVAGQLYRAQNNNHYNVFLVTPEGVILTDPINRDFARWLKGEIAQRFKVPVRYVLYSHHDWDHASGGAVFADTAEFVGHASMLAELAVPAGHRPLPMAQRKLDTNSNGVVERAEATAGNLGNFDLLDQNRDGLVTGAEFERGPVNDVYPPTQTFSDRHTVTLGGRTVEMVHMGNAHSPDGTVIYFPAERTVFGADVVQARRVPMTLSPTIGAYQDALRVVLSLDFDIVAPGHALVGTKKDVADGLGYLTDLATGVAAGVAAGRTLAEIQKSLTLETYRDFERWDTHRAQHIAEVYALLRGTR